MELHVGQTFGDYLVTGILGAGGMGRVYKVEHSLTKRTEAMKVLSAEFATDIQIKRFEREMLVLARLQHPNIAVLHNALHWEKHLILLMEFIDGVTLESKLAGGRLSLDIGLGYIRQALSALRYAHQQGVVHRDVTPANILVTPTGEIKLMDFGLSKSFGDPLLTNCGEILGSLPYLAPEQLKGVTRPDRRSDLYSAGAILYEQLTGRKPFGEHRRLAPILTDSEPDPQPPSQLEPSLPLEWDEIIRHALARNPDHRYQSADEFLTAIAALECRPGPDILLPPKRTMGIGIAIAAGLLLGVAALPAFSRYYSVTPLEFEPTHFHIAPPDFARSIPTPPRPHAIAKHPPAVIADLEAPIPAPPKRTFWSKLNVFKRKETGR
jgi:serine/threonine-protein kinase